jgi:5,5'-dehydrodivanillate O-demethylase
MNNAPILNADFEHTGPGTAAGKLLRQRWQPVHASDELKVGHPLPLRVLGEDFTIYRGEDGVARVVEARCPHRGLVLSVAKVEGSALRCRYHGWKFDGQGQCVEQPFERRCFADKVQIRSYPVEEYFGFVWLYLGEGEPPPLPRWPELEPYGRFSIIELRRWNWFHDLENTVDDVHQMWVHKEGIYQDAGQSGVIPEMIAFETDHGLMQCTAFPNGFVRKLSLVMPNMLYFTSGAGILRGFKSFLWNVPVDDTSHKMFFLFVATHLDPEAGKNVADGVRAGQKYVAASLPPAEEVIQSVLSGRQRWEDLEPRPDLVLIEDGIILVGQGILPDRSKNRLGSSDAAIVLLRKIYAREMAALERGDRPHQYAQATPETLAAIDAHPGFSNLSQKK